MEKNEGEKLTGVVSSRESFKTENSSKGGVEEKRYVQKKEIGRVKTINREKFLFFPLLVMIGILFLIGFSLAVTTISDNSIILEPSSEPKNPVFGMIYIDNAEQFRFYNGGRWIGLVFEDDEDCKAQWECDDWGDCINDYQTRSCENLKPACSGEKPEERNSCTSDVEAIEETVIEEEVTEETSEQIPEELLDASITLDENIISSSEDLTVRVSLKSFGRKFASARLIYTISDSEGNNIHSSFDEARIYTERVVTKRFEDLNLEEGNYILNVNIEYAGILEEFDQSFEIRSSPLKKIREFFSKIFGG